MRKGEIVLNLFPLVAMAISIIAAFSISRPTEGAYVGLSLGMVGFVLFSLAKWSLLRQGKLLTFGSSEMSAGYAVCYKLGYLLMGCGVVTILLVLWGQEVAS